MLLPSPPIGAVFPPFFPEPKSVRRQPAHSLASYRAIWISDFHLGTRGSKAKHLLAFLARSQCEYLYLVGDIVEGWRLTHLYWPRSHSQVLQEIMSRGHTGTRVVYIPGNHDEFFRQFAETVFGTLEIRRAAIHRTRDGRRLLIMHGDEFDGGVNSRKWLSRLGDQAYRNCLVVSDAFSKARGALGYEPWSLSAYLKRRVKRAVQARYGFDAAVTETVRQAGADALVCGHTHIAEAREIGPIQYFNDGDWVESCTALVEHHDGRLELLCCLPPPDAAAARAAADNAVEPDRLRAALSNAPARPERAISPFASEDAHSEGCAKP